MSDARKIFISYRHVAEDQRLASLFFARFKAAGHDVFIDQRIGVGTDWVKAIDDRIAWCDDMVVLISADAAKSEMVQQEVLLATSLGKRLLPVRLNFTGPLDYRLDAKLSRIQYLLWTSAADDDGTAAKLLEVLSGGDDMPEAEASEPAAEAAASVDARPSSSADPRILQQPELSRDDPCYIVRDTDARVMARVMRPHGLTILKAPRQMGKTSLVLRYLAAAVKQGRCAGYIGIGEFETSKLQELPAFLKELQRKILGIAKLDGAGLTPPSSIGEMSDFMEDTVFARQPLPLTLALDDIDKLAERPPKDDVFGMLRNWKNRAATEPERGWDRLDLLLAVASEPAAFIGDATQSPFNVPGSEPDLLKPFDPKAIRQLIDLFKAGLTAEHADALAALTGGHPYLMRAGLWRLFGPDGGSFTPDSLEAEAANDDGPFSEHLRAKYVLLNRQPEHVAALGVLLKDGRAPQRQMAYRLKALGLVKEGKDGKIVMANGLYERYFRRVLLQ